LALSVSAESVRSYDFNVLIADDGKSFSAVETIDFVPEFKTDRIMFHLDWNGLQKNTLLYSSAPLSFQQEVDLLKYSGITVSDITVNGISRTLVPGVDPTVAEITFPEGVKKGTKYTIKISFTAQVPKRLLRYGFNEADGATWITQWFPKIGVLQGDDQWACEPARIMTEYFADYSMYTLTVSAPAAYSVISNCSEKSKKTIQGRTEYQFSGADIHDCMFGYSKNFAISNDSWNGIHLRYISSAVMSEESKKTVFDRIKKNFELLSGWVGSYPYDEFTVAEVAEVGLEAGGMEYPRLIHVRINKQIFGRALDHEMAHQWFYGIVGFNETEEAWLDEGFSSYYEFRLDNLRPGRRFGTISYNTLDYTYLRYLTSKNSDGSVWETAFLPWDSFYSYVKTPVVFSMTASLSGEKVFDDFAREIVSRYKFKHPTRADVLLLAKERFDAGVYNAMVASLEGKAFNYSITEKEEMVTVTKSMPGLPDLPVTVVYGSEKIVLMPEKTMSEALIYTVTLPKKSPDGIGLTVYDANPNDSIIIKKPVISMVLTVLILAGLAGLLLFLRKRSGELVGQFLRFLAATLIIVTPILLVLGYKFSQMTTIACLGLPYRPFVPILATHATWLPMVILIFSLTIIALVARSSLFSIKNYAEPEAVYSLWTIIAVDLAFFLIIPIYTVTTLAIGHFSIMLFTLFVLLLAMAEPFKLMVLIPSKKALLAYHFKTVIIQSIIINFFGLCAVLIVLMLAAESVTTIHGSILLVIIFTALEYLYRMAYSSIVQKLPETPIPAGVQKP